MKMPKVKLLDNNLVEVDGDVYDYSLLKVGDILNYKPLPVDFSSIDSFFKSVFLLSICFFTRGKFNHTSLVTTINDPTEGTIGIKITEAYPEDGVITKFLNPKWFPKLVVYRTPVSEEELISIAGWWEGKSGCAYDGVAAFMAGFRAIINFFRKENMFFDAVNKFFCSNGVALAFASKQKRVADVNPSQTIPGDINKYGNYAIEINLKKIKNIE